MPGFPVLHHLAVSSNACPLSQWCHPTISSSVVPFSSCLQSFPASGSSPMSRLFSSGSQSIGFSFSINLSNGYSELNSFRINWFDLFAVQRTFKESSLAPQSKGINSLVLSLFYYPPLTSVYDYWKNQSFDYTDLCRQSQLCFLKRFLGLSVLFFLRSEARSFSL